MEISIEAARTLDAIVREGTFDGAARALRLTPSAVSQRVKAIERQLGRVLLVRARPVRATEAGAAVIRLARQLDLLEHEALGELGWGGAGARPVRIPLAVNADSLGTWFLPALAPLAERHSVVFELFREDQDRTTRLLESGEVMAAVTSEARPVPGCVASPLGRMRYEPVASPTFVRRWLAGGQDAAVLARAPLVDFDRDDELQTRFLRSRGIDPAGPPRHSVPASADFAAAILLGLGWGLLPPEQAAAALADGRLVRLEGEAIDVPLHWQQWNLRSPLLDAIALGVAAAARRSLA